jgi:hypothetical protein
MFNQISQKIYTKLFVLDNVIQTQDAGRGLVDILVPLKKREIKEYCEDKQSITPRPLYMKSILFSRALRTNLTLVIQSGEDARQYLHYGPTWLRQQNQSKCA